MALIELAVVLPVLLMVGLGVLEFGNAIYNYHLISVGVRDAARYEAGIGSDANGYNAKCIALTGTIQGSSCSPATSPSCTTACRISWWNDASTVTVTPSTVPNADASGNKLYRGGPTINLVTVKADVPYQSIGFLGYLGLGDFTLSTKHVERSFGVR